MGWGVEILNTKKLLDSETPLKLPLDNNTISNADLYQETQERVSA